MPLLSVGGALGVSEAVVVVVGVSPLLPVASVAAGSAVFLLAAFPPTFLRRVAQFFAKLAFHGRKCRSRYRC